MRERIEAVTIAALEPLPVEPPVLSVATAIRVFERYPILERVTLIAGGSEISLARQVVQRRLEPNGLGAVKEWGRWRQVLARAVQACLAETET